jgi:small-conductance mechanosensitive channel
MKKAYFLVPVIGVLIFSVVYWNATKDIEARKAAVVQAAEQARQQKIQDEAAARQKAYKDAIALADRRKKERAEREAKEEADKEAREALNSERDKMYREGERLTRQIERQTKDVQAEKEEIAKIEEQKRGYLSDQEFLKSYVTKAEVNQKALEDVLNKIAAADKAAADAAKAAAAAKAKS